MLSSHDLKEAKRYFEKRKIMLSRLHLSKEQHERLVEEYNAFCGTSIKKFHYLHGLKVIVHGTEKIPEEENMGEPTTAMEMTNKSFLKSQIKFCDDMISQLGRLNNMCEEISNKITYLTSRSVFMKQRLEELNAKD